MNHPTTVREIRATEVATPGRNDALDLIDSKIGCLAVVQGDTLLGLVTDTDFLRLLTRQ